MDIIASDKKNPPPFWLQIAQSWPMYRAFVGVGIVCGFLIVVAFVLTGPFIQDNQAQYLEQAVLEVLPGASNKKIFVKIDNSENGKSNFVLADGSQKSNLVYVAYDPQGKLVGIAVEAQGMGYQDIIRVLYGYDPMRQAIVGMKILASKETPGLGDKIEKDMDFIENFKALDVSLHENEDRLENTIQFVKHGHKTQAWQVDGITGATISSTAITNILKGSSQRWVPTLYRHVNTFSEGGSDGKAH